ncbi:tetratricopeptide repeat protein [Candidatus Poribacteria bacterium]|nr:tetratricopeptide repeat protein [Candidatus Poribacteria bacterium]
MRADLMDSIYPDDVIRAVLSRLDALDVLEFLDYHPESIQRADGTIRCFCPIHQEDMFRTLTIDESSRTYRCSHTGCPGSQGGDLIHLTAYTRRMAYDDAVQRLVDEFMVDVVLPEKPEEVQHALDQAFAHLDAMNEDPAQAAGHRASAVELLERALQSQPRNLPALEALVPLLQEDPERTDASAFVIQLSLAREDAGQNESIIPLLESQLEVDPSNLELRKRLAEFCLTVRMADRGVNEYLLLADEAEVIGNFDLAIDAYRQVERTGSGEVDVRPLINALLQSTGRSEDAARECLERARHFRSEGENRKALAELRMLLEMRPRDPQAALETIDLLIRAGLGHDEYAQAVELSDVLLGAELWEEAAEALTNLAGAHPDDTILLERLIQAHQNLGNFDLVAEMQYRLIGLYREREDYLSARVILDEILDTFPEDEQALQISADLAWEDGDEEGFVSHLFRLARVRELAGKVQEAVELAGRAFDALPARQDVLNRLAGLLIKAGEGDAIEATLDRGLAAMREAGNQAGVQSALQLAVSVAPDFAKYHAQWADALEAANRLDEASAERLRTAELLLEIKDIEQAEAHLRRCVEHDPACIPAVELLSRTMAGTGRKKDARTLRLDLAANLKTGGRLKESREVFESLLDEDSQDMMVLESLREVCEALGDTDRLLGLRLRALEMHKQKRRYKAAIQEGEAILAQAPGHAGALHAMMELCELTGDVEGVNRCAWMLVKALQEEGRLDEAREVLAEIAVRCPQDIKVHEALCDASVDGPDAARLLKAVEKYAALCIQASELERAIASLRGWVLRDMQNLALHHILIRLYESAGMVNEQTEQILTLIAIMEQNGQRAETIPQYRALSRLHPDDVRYRIQVIAVLDEAGRREDWSREMIALAQSYLTQGKADEAQAAFQEILQHDRENEAAHRGLANLSRAVGEKQDAIHSLRELAAIQRKQKRFPEALATLREALEIQPDHFAIRREVIQMCADDEYGRVNEASRELESLAKLYQDRGDDDAAAETWREAISLQPENASLRRQLIDLLVAAERIREAAAELRALARYHRASGSAQMALNILEEAAQLDPNDIESRSMCAQMLEEMGDEKRALAEWRAIAPMIAQARTIAEMPTQREEPEEVPPLGILDEYDFTAFVVGDKNRFAYATAMAIAKTPGKTPHNPLFLYADVGLGKTHILHGIANFVFKHHPGLKVVYTNAEDFTSELIDAIQNNTVVRFQKKYKSADLLLLDDVHFLAGQERAQEEFFHIFNALFQARKQIVVTSDRPPKDIAHLEKRLKSRFGAGVIVDIEPPDYESRMAILRQAARVHPELDVSGEAIAMLAEAFDSNIRELKGAFHQFLLLNEIGGEALSAATARKVIAQLRRVEEDLD